MHAHKIKVKARHCAGCWAHSRISSAKKYLRTVVLKGHNCTPYTVREIMHQQSFRKRTGELSIRPFFSDQKTSRGKPMKSPRAVENCSLTRVRLPPQHTATPLHIIVNSVSFRNGKKLHMSPTSLQEQRQANDEICRTHGFSVLEPYDGQKKKKRLTPGEYRAAMRGESWKFRLIKAIDEALEYSSDKKSFILNMEYEGYEVRWTDTRMHILFTTPEGRKCRDDSLHDETYLKETLEKLFAYRAAYGYEPRTPEPPEGWLGQANSIGKLASDAVRLGKSVEKMADVPPP